MNRHEYQAYQSLNETAKANKRMAHDARARHEMPQPVKRKRISFLDVWEVMFFVYLLAVGAMFAYGSIN